MFISTHKDSNEYNPVLGGRGWLEEPVAWKTSFISKVKRSTVFFILVLRIHLHQGYNEYAFLGNQSCRRRRGISFLWSAAHPIVSIMQVYSDISTRLIPKSIWSWLGWRQKGIAFYGLGAPGQPLPPIMENYRAK